MNSRKISARAFRRRAIGRGAGADGGVKDKPEKATWKWIVEMALISATLLIAYFQLQSVNDGLSSSAAAAVYQQQQDIDDIFVEKPEVTPYFSDKKTIPAELTDDEESKVKAVAFRILDHFEHIRYQLETGLFEVEEEAWRDYMETSFEDSRVLCEMLLKYNSEYDGLEEGTLWEESAATGCASLGITPAST